MSYQNILAQARAQLEAQKQLADLEAELHRKEEEECQAAYVKHCLSKAESFIHPGILKFLSVESYHSDYRNRYVIDIPECTPIKFSLHPSQDMNSHVSFTVDGTPELSIEEDEHWWIYTSSREDENDLMIAIAHANENYVLHQQFEAEIAAHNKEMGAKQEAQIDPNQKLYHRALMSLHDREYGKVIEICMALLDIEPD